MSKKNRRDKKKFRKTLSPEQLAANRQNAQLSTGPTSEEGKEASSRNATTHGAWSEEKLLMPWEDQDVFNEFYAGLEEEYQPRSASEVLALDDYIWACWRVRRLRAHEVRLMTTVEDPARLNHELFKLSQTEMRIRRIRDKALAQFHEVRKLRRQNRRQEMRDMMSEPLVDTPAADVQPNAMPRPEPIPREWLDRMAAKTGLSPVEILASFRAAQLREGQAGVAGDQNTASSPAQGGQNGPKPPPSGGH